MHQLHVYVLIYLQKYCYYVKEASASPLNHNSLQVSGNKTLPKFSFFSNYYYFAFGGISGNQPLVVAPQTL